MDLFSDLSVPVEVRIGQRTMTIKQILGVSVGGTITLDKVAGDTVDVLVGNVRLGSAEVIVIEDRLAVRITGLCSAAPPAPAGGTSPQEAASGA